MKGMRFNASMLVLLLMVASQPLVAQEKGENKWYNRLGRWVTAEPWEVEDAIPMVHTKTLLGAGQYGVVDEYLSPISHFGKQFSVTALTDYAKPSGRSWHLYQEAMAMWAMPENNANKTVMDVYRGEFSLGPAWRVLHRKGWSVDVAPLLNLQLQLNWKASNTNNYGNVKGTMGLDAWSRVRYQLPWKVSKIAISYSAQYSLIHGTFQPAFGQSYYEYISGGKRTPLQIHLTALHNNLTLRQRLLVDFPIHHLTLTLGAEYYHQNQKLSHTQFTQGYWGVLLGVSWDSFWVSGGRATNSKSITNSLY